MLRKMRFRHFEQLRSREQIEKADCIDALRASANLLSVLLGMKLRITLSQGWPLGWFGKLDSQLGPREVTSHCARAAARWILTRGL
jgi:hypothetical protein